MGAPELLRHLRDAGLVLTLTADGRLHVAPRTALTDDHRAAIRTERDALVLALQAEAAAEAFEERAAIMEFEGGLSRAEAEVAARHCVDCEFFGRRGTCLEPVAAGLRTEKEGFGIAWPDEGQATTCTVFSAKATELAQERPHKLTLVQSHAAHAEPWSEEVIVRFQARTAANQRHGCGAQDAEDLAEQLHLRDVEGDRMVMCMECSHYRPGRCGNHRAAELMVPELPRVVTVMFQRCPGFEVVPSTGKEVS